MRKTILLFLISLALSLSIFSQRQKLWADDRENHNDGGSQRGALDGIEFDSTYVRPEQKFFDVIHYSIKIRIDCPNKEIHGDVTINGIQTAEAKGLFFNLYDNIKIDSLTVNDSGKSFFQTNRSLFIDCSLKASTDTIKVRIKYHGTPKRLGFSSFVFGEINGIPLVHSLNEPQYASTWFPCDDDPADKAYSDLYITADSSMISVSNGKLIEITSSGDEKTYHWRSTYPISTYLICIYSSRYKCFSDSYITAKGDTMPIEYYVTPRHLENARKDFAGHVKMMEFLSSSFGEYPFIKEKYGVAEFLWQAGAMEHQTITGVGSSLVKGTGFLDELYLHELAHQWFGNSVTPASWSDVWLNEGFASYCEALYDEHLEGKGGLDKKMLEYSDYRGTGALYNPSLDLFSDLVYHRGAWTLHMLRGELGDSAFFQCIRSYYQKYKYSNASTKDFIDAIQSCSGKDLSRFFKQWVYDDSGIPVLEFTWNNTTFGKDGKLILNIVQAQENKYTFNFPLEVQLEYDGKSIYKTVRIDSSRQTFTFDIDNRPNAVVLDPNMKLLVKIYDRNPYE